MADGIQVKWGTYGVQQSLFYVRAQLQYNINGVLGQEADKAATWIADHYLHGQAMNRITGNTIRHFGVRWSKREKAYVLAPGYGIPGNQNYLARFVGTKHEFVRPGFNAYFSAHDVMPKLQAAVDKLIREAQQ